MDTMDALVRRAGFVPLFLVSLVCAFVAAGTGEERPLWRAFVTVAQVATFLVALRAAALRGDAERRGAPPPPMAARVRWLATRIRFVLAPILGAVVWWSTQRSYDRWWLSVLVTLLIAAAFSYTMAPLPSPPADGD